MLIQGLSDQTFRMNPWQELAFLRGTGELTTFRENELGPRGCGDTVQPPPCQKQRQAETVPGAWGLPWRMHLNFKKEKKELCLLLGPLGIHLRRQALLLALAQGGQQLGWVRARKAWAGVEAGGCRRNQHGGLILLRDLTEHLSPGTDHMGENQVLCTLRGCSALQIC